jgi:putative ABC transport system permease protein
MIFNYLKIAARNLFSARRDGSALYSWINLLGLTVGLAAFLFIAHYILYQLSYDRFFTGHDRMYRLAVERQERGEVTLRSAKTFAGVGAVLSAEMPGLGQWVRILDEECMFEYEPDKAVFNRQRTFWADGNFPGFFGLEMLITAQMELLHQPNHAIISRSAAVRFFGTDWREGNKPLGKTVILNGGVPFMIQGVFEDLPPNSHMRVDFVVSYSTLMALLGEFMNTVMPPERNFVYNYLIFNEKSDNEKLEEQINRVIAGHTGQLDEQVSYRFFLQPVASIHLDSRLSDELNPNGSRFFIWALSIAALLIVAVAWINFVNLTIARALSRSREVGVRKAIGAMKRQVGVQFAVETLFSGFLAVLFVLIIAILAGGTFSRIAGIPVSMFGAQSGWLWIVFLGAVLAGALTAGSYPALLMSSFHPIRAIKGNVVLHSGNGLFRQGLITFQFGAALLLIACTGAVYHQVSHMRRQALGADLDQVLVLHSPRSMIGNPERALHFRRFRDQLEQQGDIMSVASGGCLPGEKFLFHTENVQAEGLEREVSWSFDVASVDERYLPTLGIDLLAGRNFEDRPGEEHHVLLNELAAKGLGFRDAADAVGKFIRIDGGERRQIAGVVADVHFEGLQASVKPLLLGYGHEYEFGFFPVKIRSSDLRGTMERTEALWRSVYPRDPFDYFFLDEFFDRQYKNDEAFGQMFGAFALLTIAVAGLGLFGLVSLTTYQKSREIGIRKVLGAGVLSIVALLTAGFLRLMLIAALIFLPLAHWIIGRWLDTFAHRFEPSWWLYALPLVALLVTSLLAVGGQTLKSALRNPVEAIAEE